MEEWDPRDVSFITPPCNLHSFTLLLSSLSSPLHPFHHFSSSLFLDFFFLLSHFQRLSFLPPPPSHHLSLTTLALVFRFHYLLWRRPFVLLSIPFFFSHFLCQQEEKKSLFSLEKKNRERTNKRRRETGRPEKRRRNWRRRLKLTGNERMKNKTTRVNKLGFCLIISQT